MALKHSGINHSRLFSRRLAEAITLLEGKHKLGCALLHLPDDLATKIHNLSAEIADKDLTDKGIEDEPHTTALYGFTDDDPAAIKKLIKGFGEIEIEIGECSLFENDDADVIKFEVKSQKLHKLNKLLATLPHENTHPDYKPHITIAYVKSGKGQRYLDELDTGSITGKTAILRTLTFSPADGNKQQIDLI